MNLVSNDISIWTLLFILSLALLQCDSKTRRAQTQPPEYESQRKQGNQKRDKSRKKRGPNDSSSLTTEYLDLEGSGQLLAKIKTSLGTMRCRMYEQKAPRTTANFVGLATGKKAWRHHDTGRKIKGKPFYNGTEFYRIVPNFAIFAGDRTGTGNKGPGFEIKDEFNPDLSYDRPGTMGMVSKGPPDTGGSRFFITLKALPRLDDKHPIFGRCNGLEVIRKIAQVPTSPDYKPENPPNIYSVQFFRRP